MTVLYRTSGLSELIGEKYPDTPLFILGHSFGSFLAQEYAKRYSDSIAGMILSGSAFVSKAEIKAGLLLASASLLFGKHRPNRLLDKITFGSYNKRIVYPESRFSWLSRDKDEVAKYDADPFCGQVMSTAFSCFKGLDGLAAYGKTAGNNRERTFRYLLYREAKIRSAVTQGCVQAARMVRQRRSPTN